MVTPVLFGAGAALGWGLHDFFAKLTLKKTNPLETLFKIKLVGTLAMLLLLPFNQLSPKLLQQDILLATIAIGIFGTFGFLMLLTALKKGKIGIVTPISSAGGAFAAIGATIFLREILSLNQIGLVSLVVAGVMLASYDPTGLKKINLLQAKGAKEAIAAAILWGFGFNAVGYLVNNLGWFNALVAIQLAFLTVAGVILFVKKEKFLCKDYKPFIILGSLDLLGFISYNLGEELGFTAILAPIGSAYPVVASALGYLFLRERISANQKLGVAAVIAGVIALSIG